MWQNSPRNKNLQITAGNFFLEQILIMNDTQKLHNVLLFHLLLSMTISCLHSKPLSSTRIDPGDNAGKIANAANPHHGENAMFNNIRGLGFFAGILCGILVDSYSWLLLSASPKG